MLLTKIKLVPTLEAYLVNYLKSANREGDFNKLIKTPALRMKPPSAFLRLLDSYLFNNLRKFNTHILKMRTLCLQNQFSGKNFALDTINERMERLCAALCQDLTARDFRKCEQQILQNSMRVRVCSKPATARVHAMAARRARGGAEREAGCTQNEQLNVAVRRRLFVSVFRLR